MADPEHVAALKQGRDAFRVWRDQHRETVPDLSGADLTGEDLTGVNLDGCDLSAAIFRNANLSSAQLANARLEQADLSEAKCSRDQSTYQLGLSVVHYLADAWRRRVWRVAALFFYFTGGAGAVIVLGSKLLGVAEFLLRNHAWSL